MSKHSLYADDNLRFSSSLLKNWEKEFKKWLGNERITIHVADTGDKVAQFRSYGSAPVLLLSYEMMVRCSKELLQVPWDLKT